MAYCVKKYNYFIELIILYLDIIRGTVFFCYNAIIVLFHKLFCRNYRTLNVYTHLKYEDAEKEVKGLEKKLSGE